MSAATLMNPAVTPAKVRRRGREQQLRGPVARPQQLVGPGRRPVQPVAPGAGAPVELRRAPRPVAPRSRPVAGQVQLTDRGLALVLGLVGLLVVAAVAVVVTRFFGVSNAPLESAPQGNSVAVSAVVGAGAAQ